MQTRICDCWMDIGHCNCAETKTDERKRTNTTKEQSKEPRGSNERSSKPNDKHERPLDWDARDLEADTWLRESSRATKGRYTNRFFEGD